MKRIFRPLIFVIFYLMLWMRGIFKLLSNFIAGLSLIVSIIVLIHYFVEGKSEYALLGWTAFIVGFIVFLIGNFYDSILLKINPTDKEYTLID